MPTVNCPHCSKGIDLPTDGATYTCPHCRKPVTAPTTALTLPAAYTYKMVQIPPNVTVADGESRKGILADYLEDIVNKYARKGWEFWRVDELGVRVRPGCFAGLLGARSYDVKYSVITFRKPS